MDIKSKTVIKKKRWVQIFAPEWIDKSVIGETHVVEPEEAIGKTLSVSFGFLTGDPQKQHINLKFLITGKQNDGLATELIGYIFSLTAAKRFVRKGREKVEDSFVAVTKDGKKIRLKYVLLTKGSAKGTVKASLNAQVKENLLKQAADLTFQEFMDSLLQHKLPKELSVSLKKIYPIAISEIRWAELVRSKEKEAKEKENSEETVQIEIQKPAEATV